MKGDGVDAVGWAFAERSCPDGRKMRERFRVLLKKGREKSVLQRHPWVFSGAIKRVVGIPEPGSLVEVADAEGRFLALGYFNPHSQITVRLITWQEEPVDVAFWQRRLQRAIQGRRSLFQDPHTTAFRLVNAESDGIPGLVVDLYGRYLVVQFLTLGIERWKEELVGLLMELVEPEGVYERDDVEVRRKEGLEERVGTLQGREPPDLIEVLENGLRFLVDVKRGQKTGFYLDQRENRRRFLGYAEGREVLDAFAYTGAFSVYAARQGARSIVQVESSAEARRLARENMALNGFQGQAVDYIGGDVFQVLRRFREEGRRFDLIVLDPPKFARAQAHLSQATRGYKDVNWLALQLLRPEGILFTFSCSGLVSPDLFQKIVFGASLDARREVQIIGKLSQASDHPVLLSFPESEYLKGLVCRAL